MLPKPCQLRPGLPVGETTILTTYRALACALYHFRYNLPLTNPALLDLRQNAISTLNSALSSPDERSDDSTIAAVFCMCSLESVHGDRA